jgi:ABC-type transport system involved in cytochrome bd biosynthesis fused ATPase/permease subunit
MRTLDWARTHALLAPTRFSSSTSRPRTSDPPLAARLLPRVLALAAGRAVLVITHDSPSLSAFDRVLRLSGGRLHPDLTPLSSETTQEV